MCVDAKIDIVVVPGASSIMPALVGSGFQIEKFYYAGWLSPKKDIRRKELMRLKGIKELIVLMETPYRLTQLLTDVSKIFGAKIKICVAFDLTLPNEKFYRGFAIEILKTVSEKKLKGEFVLIINNR